MKKKLKCFVCHKEINEEEDYVFKGQTVHKGVCLKSMIDEYNTIRNLQIRNKRLCSEIDRLNNIIKELSKDVDMWNKKYNEQFDIISELEKWIEKHKQYQLISERYIVWEDKLVNKLKELKNSDNNE